MASFSDNYQKYLNSSQSRWAGLSVQTTRFTIHFRYFTEFFMGLLTVGFLHICAKMDRKNNHIEYLSIRKIKFVYLSNEYVYQIRPKRVCIFDIQFVYLSNKYTNSFWEHMCNNTIISCFMLEKLSTSLSYNFILGLNILFYNNFLCTVSLSTKFLTWSMKEPEFFLGDLCNYFRNGLNQSS